MTGASITVDGSLFQFDDGFNLARGTRIEVVAGREAKKVKEVEMPEHDKVGGGGGCSRGAPRPAQRSKYQTSEVIAQHTQIIALVLRRSHLPSRYPILAHRIVNLPLEVRLPPDQAAILDPEQHLQGDSPHRRPTRPE